jgi:hypothetical protein
MAQSPRGKELAARSEPSAAWQAGGDRRAAFLQDPGRFFRAANGGIFPRGENDVSQTPPDSQQMGRQAPIREINRSVSLSGRHGIIRILLLP